MNNKITDQSNDRSYFVITPQLVWALCKDVYEYTLWGVVKMIAGEQGQCMLSTPDLAAAAMMSTGKCSECRKRLIDAGLLQGDLRRDPDYPQPVWHLTVPDLWAKNLEWRQKNDSLLDRIEGKRRQKESFHTVKPSRGERGPPPGERGTSPREEGPPPGETKKNHDRTMIEPKEEPKTPDAGASDSSPDDFSDLEWSTGDETPPREGPSILDNGDPFSMAAACEKASKGKPSWTVPAEAGGSDPWANGPVDAFCAVYSIPDPPDKKRQWFARQLEGVATEWGATPKEVTDAIRAIPKSDQAWRTFAAPRGDSWDDLLGMMIARVQSGDAGPVLKIRN